MRRKRRLKTSFGRSYAIALTSHARMKRILPRDQRRGHQPLGRCQTLLLKNRSSKDKIWINERLRGWQMHDVLVHEMLHAEFPHFSEWKVEALGKSLARASKLAWKWAHALEDADKNKK